MPGKAIAHYLPEEKEAALRLTAKIGITAAARELGLDRKTISRFRDQMPAFWSELISGSEVAPERKRRAAESLEDLADAYTEREFEALQRAEKLIKTADGKELAALMRAMGASRGLAHASARAYRGEDTQHVEHNINFTALEQAAQAILNRAAQPAIEGTAEDA